MAPIPSTLLPRPLLPGEHFWPITPDQAARLSTLLNTDFPLLGVSGALIGSPQLICAKCGKLSGLEDFVFEALQLGIHTPEFIVEDLKAGGSGRHRGILRCMDCGEAYLRSGTDEEEAAATKRELERRHGTVGDGVVTLSEREPEREAKREDEKRDPVPAPYDWWYHWVAQDGSGGPSSKREDDKRDPVPAPYDWWYHWVAEDIAGETSRKRQDIDVLEERELESLN